MTFSSAQSYFGNFASGASYALYIAPGGSAVLLGNYPDGRSGLLTTFPIDAAGNFTSPSLSAQSGPPVTPWVFTGQVLGGILTAHTTNTGETFSAVAAPTTAAAAGLAGYYPTALLNSNSGGVYTIVGTDGRTLSVINVAGVTEVASGTISTGGQLSALTTSGTVLTGSVNAQTTQLTASLNNASGAIGNVAGSSAPVTAAARLLGISARATVGTPGDGRVLITGFILGGTQPQSLLLRGIGPGLASLGITNAVPHPTLRLFDAGGNLLLQNTQWDSTSPALAAAFSRVGDFALPAGSLDSAVLTTLAPGAYTVQVVDATATGTALSEIYDAGASSDTSALHITALSTRGFAGTGDNILIGGFVVSGQVPQTVLVRGVGPMLQHYGVTGVLNNPKLSVYDATGQLVAQNDDWGTPVTTFVGQTAASAAALVKAAADSGAAPLDAGSKDAALLLTLAPGAYTAHVESGDTQTGVALVEFYLVSH